MGGRFTGFAALAACLSLLACAGTAGRSQSAAPAPVRPQGAAAPSQSVAVPSTGGAPATSQGPTSTSQGAAAASQEQVGKDLIARIVRGDFPAARAYFDTSIRNNVTPEIFRGVQAQLKELSGAAVDSVEQVSTGETVAQHWGPIFFREYRFVNEVGKGPPGALINVSFNDSTSDKVLGLFIKRLLEVSKSGQISTYRGQEKTLAGAQKWNIGGKEVDVNEIVLLDFREGHMLSIKVFDKDADALTMPVAKQKAVPIVKAAIAKGILKQAKAETPDLMDRIGVAFLIPDGSGGFRAQLEPSEYD